MRHQSKTATEELGFEILGPLGSGGFGAVYEAFDRRNGQRVALKELTRLSPDSLFRFKQEFRALADIHHPNLVAIKELIDHDGRWYIVMELVEGENLFEFVRPGGKHGMFDEERLREAFGGVARGLHALHEHDILHRDLKPSNVRVTTEGRAVLLDFGLVTSVNPQGQSTHAMGMGTVLYMAPEQFDGAKLGRSADWYAFGSCLYEALTGRPPFEGSSALRVALDKQRREPVHPRTLVPGVPQDLATLAMRLLHRSPEQRPESAEVRSVLEGISTERMSLPVQGLPSLLPAGTFAGRESELKHLEQALAHTHEGALRIVLIEGESGVGKSELVAEFVRRQRTRNAATLTLRGRCYQNEQVSYKAFDGCIDELARTLRRMGPAADVLMPSGAALLAQLFPVLGDLPAFQARSESFAADPTARRLQAFSALAALTANLAEERPLVIVIDDLQWADAESFRLLRALVEDPRRPPLLVIATVRPRAELDADVLAHIEAVRAWQCADVIPITGLPSAEAEELARLLLGPEADPSWAGIIAEESQGHPLFLSELILFTKSREAGATLSLESALKARIERLPRQARALLELVALAARPHAPRLFAAALEVPRVDEAATVLLGAKLLRARRDHELGCFHDRIRHVTVSLIPTTRLPLLHRRLAEALAQEPGSDPTERASHWDLAGDTKRAVEDYEAAATRAFASMAFVQAAKLHGHALELMGDLRDERYTRALVGRANALACAGRSADAAALYRRASELERVEEQRLRLRGRVAHQLLLSGDVQMGLAACRQLLAEFGVSLPSTDLGAIARSFWDRLWLRLTGYRLRSSVARGDEPRARLALELLGDFLSVLNLVQTQAFLAYNGQYARRALALGDVRYAALAYANEAWLRGAREGLRKAAALFEASRKLSEPLRDAVLAARQTSLEGSARTFGYDFEEGAALLVESERLHQAHCAHDPWSLTLVRFRLSSAWYHTGEHAQLAQQVEGWLGEARERQDRFAVALLSGVGYGSVRHLMRGEPMEALRELDEALAALPAEPYSFAHLGHMMSTQVALSMTTSRAAWDWFSARQAQLSKPFLLRTRLGKEVLCLYRTTAALRACEAAAPSERKTLLAFVRKNADHLSRQRSEFTKAFAHHYRAQAYAIEGARERAIQHARVARRGFERCKYTGALSAAYLEGLLEGGEAGAKTCAEVLTQYREQGWADPRDAVLIVLPTMPLLDKGEPRADAGRTKLIQHYELIGPLGSGGFGSVVEARDTRSGRRVALKELVSSGARSLERFKQEFRALQSLHHPNLVRFDALFEHRGRWYIAMELVVGEDPIAYIRPDDRLDTARLKQVFEGLIAGVSALHEAGFVHRDITPDNVRVTPEGRVVLLDFGLIARQHDAADTGPLGSAAYAPPEQLEGSVPHASADVYALGACLYQALSGRLPFDAPNAPALLQQKRSQTPRPVTAPGLNEVASSSLRMLDPHPAARPALAELTRALDESADAPRAAHARRTISIVPPAASVFVGRSAELLQLQTAALLAEERFTLVLIEGESGLGKSALAAEFARQLEAQRPGLLTLKGRCYENELLALKAFDGVVDQLARALRRSERGCEHLLPRHAALLGQLFPVLRTVPAIAGATKKGLPADPGTRRSLALGCFVELLARMSAEGPLLLTIDDLQWADRDSLALLQELSCRHKALPLLVVATVRPSHELASELQAPLQGLRALPGTIVLPLARLGGSDTRTLATSLLGASVSPNQIERVCMESKGHPFFLREIAEQVRDGDLTVTGRISLEDALSNRIRCLSVQARELLVLTALAGKPYPSAVFSHALGGELSSDSSSELLKQGLLQRRGIDELTCYHDRIRRSALALLSETKARALSARLAAALDALHSGDCTERARLWEQAADSERAIVAHDEAGTRALEKLAFVQAAQHYARALSLQGDVRDERWRRLTIQYGHALVRMGRSAGAARLYAEAAEGAEGELRVKLQVWSAQHLIRGAQVEEGLRAASAILRELGVEVPKSPKDAVRAILWESLRLKLRGLEFRARAKPLAARERMALTALSELSQPVASVTILEGYALSAQHVRRALDAGDTSHAALALAYEGVLRAVRDPLKDQSALLSRAHELARAERVPAVIATVETRHSVAASTMGDFTQAHQLLCRAHDRVRSQCPDQPGLLTAARMYLGSALYYLGEYRALAAQSSEWISEAQTREDHYAYAALSGYGFGFLRHLMRDDAAAALAELSRAIQPWPEEPFSTNHMGISHGTLLSCLWTGGPKALSWFERNQERLARASVLKAPTPKLQIVRYRANAYLAAMTEEVTERNATLRKGVAVQLKLLETLRSPFAPAHAALIRAALLAVDRRTEQALESARAANALFTKLNLQRGEPAAFLEGWLEGGAAGRAKCDAELAALRAEGWSDPMRWVSTLLPIFHLVPRA